MMLWQRIGPLLLCLKLLGTTFGVAAQSTDYLASFNHLSTEQGLSQSFVYTIYQDSKGFIWFGTKEGLNRYDGYRFEVYSPQTHPLQESHIFKLEEDNYQRLWVVYEKQGLGRKIDLIDLNTGEIQPFDAVFQMEEESPLTPFVVEKDDDGAIWIETIAGTIYKLTDRNRIELLFTSPSNQKTHAYPLENGNFLFFETEIPQKDLWYYEQASGRSKLLASGIEKAVNLQNGHKRWALLGFTGSGVHVYSYEQKKILSPEDTFWLSSFLDTIPRDENIDYHNIKACYDPALQLYWISFFNRLWAVNAAGELILDLTDQLKEQIYLGIHCLYLDKNQMLWVGTNDGVISVSVSPKKFRTYANNNDPNLAIRVLLSLSDQQVLFSSETRSYVLDLEGGAFNELNEKAPGYAAAQSDTTIWLAHYGLAMNKVRVDAGVSLKVLESIQHSSNQYLVARSLWQARDGLLFIGTNFGLYTFDPGTGTFNKWTDFGAYKELVNADIFHIVETEKGLWLATAQGLYLWQAGGPVLARYATSAKAPFYIPANEIGFVYPDPDDADQLWLGTRGAGLISLHTKTGDSRQWTRANGLSNNMIYAIYGDDFDHLWLSSNSGIMQFSKQDHRIRTYMPGDGIAHQEFNTSSHHQLADGRILFGGINGITAFNPADFYREAGDLFRAPLALTKCERVSKKQATAIIETDAVLRTGQLVLKPTDLYLKIDFALLDYGGADQHLYAYRIDKLSTDWQPLDQPSVQLYSLPSGNYDLQIRARNLINGLPEQQLRFRLKVVGPFYQQIWFLALLAGVLGLITWTWFRIRLQQSKRIQAQLEAEVKSRTRQILADKLIIEQQAERLKNLDSMKSRLFANISHELRTPLSLILSPVKMLLGRQEVQLNNHIKEALLLVRRNSRSLLKLVEEILDLSKLEAEKVSLEEKAVPLLTFVNDCTAPFEYKAGQEGYDFQLDICFEPELCILLDPPKVAKILRNLLSNAFKFTPTGKRILLSAEEEKSSIVIKVIDQGFGIREEDIPHIFDRYYQSADPDGKTRGGTGIGLALSREFALLMNGSLTVESTYGSGSTFTLVFPKKIAQQPPILTEAEIVVPERPHSSGMAFATKTAADGSRKEHTILLVEDHQDLRQFIQTLLQNDVFEVYAVANGKEALQVLEEKKVDLIISDLMMPVMDGYELLHLVKKHMSWRDIPFIMLTARTALEDKLQALRIGVDDYLSKPFEPEELLLRITNLINNYQERLVYRASDVENPTNEGETGKGIDTQLLEDFERETMAHLNDPMMSVGFLANELRLSERQLYRHIKRLTGLTPNNYIRAVRLNKARELLEGKALVNVKEVGQAVGFQKTSYFSRLYQTEFGRAPSSYFR